MIECENDKMAVNYPVYTLPSIKYTYQLLHIIVLVYGRKSKDHMQSLLSSTVLCVILHHTNLTPKEEYKIYLF